MSNEINMELAKRTFDTLVNMFESRNLQYDKHEEELIVRSGIKGEDLPIDFIVVVKPSNEVVQFLSKLPFNMPEDKVIDGAIAVSAANYGLVDGSFDYNVMDGSIIFRLTSSYRDSILSEDLFEYMIMVSAATIDEYNDKFFMLAKGMIDIQKFIEDSQA